MDLDQFSSDLKKVPAELSKDLGRQPTRGLDLKKATGVEFVGVGTCTLPGDNPKPWKSTVPDVGILE